MPSRNLRLFNTFLEAAYVDEESRKIVRSRSDPVLHSSSSVNDAHAIDESDIESFIRRLDAFSASSRDMAPDSENTGEDGSHETQPSQHRGFHPSSHGLAHDADNLTSTVEEMTQVDEAFPDYCTDDELHESDFICSIEGKSGCIVSILDGLTQEAEEQLVKAPTAADGAELHPTDKCAPCAWNWRPGGCSNGSNCNFCHICPEAALRQVRRQTEHRRKQERQASRQMKMLRQCSGPWYCNSRGMAPDSENTGGDGSHETQPSQHPGFHPSSHCLAHDADNLTSTVEDMTQVDESFPVLFVASAEERQTAAASKAPSMAAVKAKSFNINAPVFVPSSEKIDSSHLFIRQFSGTSTDAGPVSEGASEDFDSDDGVQAACA